MQTFSPEVIQALAGLRTYAAQYPAMGLSGLVNTLDNAGVFAALDEQTGYAAAEDVLAEAVVTASLDPAEWGDTTPADMARHQIEFSDTHPRAARELTDLIRGHAPDA